MKKWIKSFAAWMAVWMLIFSMSVTAMAASTSQAKEDHREEVSIDQLLHYDNTEEYSCYLTVLEYDTFGEELMDVGVQFQLSEDGTRYYITNPEILDQLLDDRSSDFVRDKNTIPTVKKTVGKTESDITKSTLNVQVGDILYYKLAMTVTRGSRNVEFVDELSESILIDKTSVTLKNEKDGSNVDQENYTISYDGNKKISCKIPDGYAENVTLVLTYRAVVSDSAALEKKITKSAYASFGENANRSTPSETTIQLDQFIIDNQNGKGESLSGAQFELCDADKTIPVRKLDENELKKIKQKSGNVYYVVDCKASQDALGSVNITHGTNKTIDMIDCSTVVILGLDKTKNYELKEIRTPEGYNKLKDKQSVVWKPGDDGVNNQITVTYMEGLEMRSTGGIGTGIFYVVGTILVLTSGTLLIVRKRKTYK